MKKYSLHIIWFVIALLAFGGGVYFVKATASAPAATARGNRTFTGRAGAGGFAGGGFAAGQILSKDSESITLQLPNGNSEVVFYSSSTQVTKPSTASISDLTPGTNVMVGGMQNADGSVAAQTIQVRNGSSSPGGGGR